jgi:hypothetical protein
MGRGEVRIGRKANMSIDPVGHLGRVAESTIMRILSKAVTDGTLTPMAFDGLRYKLQEEKDLRKAIADQIRVKLMPICVCERCNNVHEGKILEDAIRIVLEG